MLVSHANAVGASRRPERAPAWQHDETRKAIVETARALVAVDSFENFSLIRVAEAAGFSPHTVYAYFLNKTELVAAIVWEDLASFARSIAEHYMPCPQDIPEPAESAAETDDALEGSVPHDDATSPFDSSESQSGCAEEHPVETARDEEMLRDAPFVLEQEDARPVEVDCSLALAFPGLIDEDATSEIRTREPPAAEDSGLDGSDRPNPLDDRNAEPDGEIFEGQPSQEQAPVHDASPAKHSAAERLAELESRLEQVETRKVDAWLERRLREFERMLSALEERTGGLERNVSGSSTSLETGLQEMRARLDSLGKRQDAFAQDAVKRLQEGLATAAKEQRQTWNELRTVVLEQASRIEMIERDRETKALAAELSPLHDAQPPALSDRQDDALSAPADDAEKAGDGAKEADESYIVAARRAALAAHTLAGAEESKTKRRPTRLLLGLCVGLGITLAGAGIALKVAVSSAAIAEKAGVAGEHRSRVANMIAKTPSVGSSRTGSPVATGDGHAEERIGLAYLEGKGVPRNEARAAKWLGAAAVAGNPVAQYALGVLFEQGRGEPLDRSQAVRWYEAAAVQGNLKAMYRLAVAKAEGWGTERNYAEAARWFSRAAEKGLADAQYNLAVLYERGLGVPQSLADAYKWYALAAAQGDKESAERVEVLTSQLTANDLAAARTAVADFHATPSGKDAAMLPASARASPAAGSQE